MVTQAQAHILAILTPVLAAISQVLIKWQVNQVEHDSVGLWGNLIFLFEFLLRPWVIVALVATFVSGLTWIMAMTRLEISYAYPYVAMSFVLVPFAGILLFGEHFNLARAAGSTLILAGIFLVMVKG